MRKRGECEKWKRRLADWCEDWRNEAKSELARDYAVSYRIDHQWDWTQHLLENRRFDEVEKREQSITKAMEDKHFRSELFLRCGHPETCVETSKWLRKFSSSEKATVIVKGCLLSQDLPRGTVRVVKTVAWRPRACRRERQFRRGFSPGKFRERLQAKGYADPRGLWQGEGGPASGSSLTEKMEEWLEKADDPELRELAAMKMPI